ncbi:MAG: beta-ketoacyl-ACP synthase III [Acidobacteriota bacterium]|jgi:3-oxoacyl-[acyl-carrier-protein] synthase-3|nr:beta-ketoacyl-ACP synthase III [Acidobacteriota bacterium]
MAWVGAKITGLGAEVPEKVLTNADLEKIVDTTDEWIVTRTGIRERRIVAEDQATSDLAIAASRKAMAHAGVEAGDIDAVIVATVSADYPFPACACLVQSALGIGGFAFDISAGCTGWIYSLVMAEQLVKSGGAKRVLCIGAECLSRITDYTDRNTCVLFGDGAGAAIVEGADEEDNGILAWDLGSDGSDPSILWQPAGGSKIPASHATVDAHDHSVRMRGRDVYVFATRIMGHTCEKTLEKAGLTPDSIALLVPHQANERITQSARERFGMPFDRIVSNVDRYGNTSSASIPIALKESLDAGRAKKDDLILVVGFGAGLTWGSCLLRWRI